MERKAGPSAGEIILYAAAAIGIGYFFWKSRIDGYYPSEMALMYGIGAVGAVAGLIGARMTTGRKRSEAQQADRDKGVR
jgi:membrane associated rhomboid family serine protease